METEPKLTEELKEITLATTDKKAKELTELLKARGFFEGAFVRLYYDAFKGFFVPAGPPISRPPPIHPSCRCAIKLEEE